VKWRTGFILQYGNLSLLAVSELDQRGIFYSDRDQSTASNPETIYILKENKWKINDVERVYGVAIEAYDVYPILKFPEVKKRNRYQSMGGRPRSSGVPPMDYSPGSAPKVDLKVNGKSAGDVTSVKQLAHPATNLRIEQIDSEFAKLLKNRQEGRAGSGCSLDGVSGRVSPNPLQPRNSSDRYVQGVSFSTPHPHSAGG